MEITLKDFKYAAHLSEGTNAFSAVVYVDGIRLAHASNNGRGGSTIVHRFDDVERSRMEEVEKFCSSLPPVFHGKVMTLEDRIDQLVQALVNDKEIRGHLRKIANACKKYVVIVNKAELEKFKRGEVDLLSWKRIDYKRSPQTMNQELRDKIKSKIQLGPDEFFFNDGWH